MLNKIQEKVFFIESFSVQKVSVAAIHFLYQLLDAVPVGLYVESDSTMVCSK